MKSREPVQQVTSSLMPT